MCSGKGLAERKRGPALLPAPVSPDFGCLPLRADGLVSAAAPLAPEGRRASHPVIKDRSAVRANGASVRDGLLRSARRQLRSAVGPAFSRTCPRHRRLRAAFDWPAPDRLDDPGSFPLRFPCGTNFGPEPCKFLVPLRFPSASPPSYRSDTLTPGESRQVVNRGAGLLIT